MTRRKHYDKLPIQGNFYPMSSAMYIEDESTRVSLLSIQPLGASSLQNGQMEVVYFVFNSLLHEDLKYF